MTQVYTALDSETPDPQKTSAKRPQKLESMKTQAKHQDR